MHAVVNIEDNIGKSVGRRRIKDSLTYALALQKSSQDMLGDRAPRFPRGVFRFRTFEEADAWTMKFLTAPRD
jgi:hypothetical protein